MLLKEYYNIAYIHKLSQQLCCLSLLFNNSYLKEAEKLLPSLEMRDRVNIIADAIYNGFEDADNASISALLIQLAHNNQDEWKSFGFWPIINVFERHFIEDYELAMQAFYAMTHLFTAEFAIRPFIYHYPEDVFKKLSIWVTDESEHIRRLASEGIRTKLPWSEKIAYLNENPQKILAILEKLKDDKSLYVRRSVANNLNDLSKDYPELVLKTLQKWYTQTAEYKWLTKHALRTLIKKGNEKALELIGVNTQFNVMSSRFNLSKNKLFLEEDFIMEITLKNKENKDVRLVLDYIIHHVKANGQTSPKIFKWKNIYLTAGQELFLQKKHKIYPVTTRKYYNGLHKVDVTLNGQVIATQEFKLIVSA